MVRYIYDAWGNHAVLDADGNDIDDPNHVGNLNPFRYRGYYYDVETGLYFLQTRYYDPEVGRFISQDSVEYADPETINGLNLYAYCGNNPVMNVDPTGTSFLLISLLVGLIIGAVAGGVIGGVTAAQNGATGWEIAGAVYLGVILGGNIGGIAGALIGVGIPLISSGLGAIGGAGGLAALAGGGTVAAGAAAGVASEGLGAGLVIAGGGIAIGGLGFGLPVLFSKGAGPRMGHNQYEDRMWEEAKRQTGIANNKDLAQRVHQKLKKYPYNETLKDLIACIRDILSKLKH